MARDTVADPDRPRPRVAMVSVDGGRIPIRAGASKAKPESHWKESKVAVLETYQSAVHDADPDPHVPRWVLDLRRTKEMVRGLGHALPVGLEFEGETPTSQPDEAVDEAADRPGRPERLVRGVLASRERAEDFGPMVHQAAWERNIFGAARRAFLGTAWR